MKISIQRFCGAGASAVVLFASIQSHAATFTVDPGAAWAGYMNVFELPANGGAYLWGSTWGAADLSANFSGDTLILSPNTINDPDPYWYVGGGGPGAPGNKNMEANFYQEITGSLAGQTVTFTGNVLANSLTTSHSALAFIKDFAPDYSSSFTTTVPLTPGTFSISLDIVNDPARHVQFGFQMTGENVWVTDVAAFGNVQITAVPEPSAAALAATAFGALAMIRRRI